MSVTIFSGGRSAGKRSMARRYGRFVISRRLIELQLETVMSIMGQCIIVRAEYLFDSDRVAYGALSNHFDIVDEGIISLAYDLYINGRRWMFFPAESDTPKVVMG